MKSNFRVEDDPGFFFNHAITTLPISSKAIGIYVRIRLLACNPKWTFSVAGLSQIIPEGKEAILGGLRELEQVGLLRRTQERLETGLMGPAVWVIYGRPQPEVSLAGEPATGNPPTDKPATDEPATDDRRQYKDISDKNKSNKETPLAPLEPEPGRVATPPMERGRPSATAEGALSVKVIPEALQPLRNEILTFWDEHKQGKKSQRAWDDQMRNLVKILEDPKGGIFAVKEQLEKAAHAAVHSPKGGWAAITYSNWRSYGVKEVSQAGGTVGYSSRGQAQRPGPPIEKGYRSEIRQEYLRNKQSQQS